MAKWNEAFDDLVDFVEEHGGSIGGEQRDRLWNIAARFADKQPEYIEERRRRMEYDFLASQQ